ncbi:cAMP-dependent protein kinase subunit [Geranomyces variabilis]|uniref:Thiamine pyrophosphokinase n=1 Tax=Geranomyces variabilis TaxID=109894 RepID=A0AAD5XPR8_9FUNG|nr:cAMP-dependent protein kinase subunit [Geranomyces variabilis]
MGSNPHAPASDPATVSQHRSSQERACCWAASSFLSPRSQNDSPAVSAFLVIVNQPLCNSKAFATLWANTSVHLCADGGANRLYDWFGDDEQARKRHIPEYICGDFDSLRADVRDWYSAQGTELVHLPSQYSTDLQKCLQVFRDKFEQHSPANDAINLPISSRPPPTSKSLSDVVILGALSGRFDHVMASIHAVFTAEATRKVYLVSGESVALLLRPGVHEITCVRSLEGPTCGLIPIGVSVAHVITKGLKWDVDHSMPLSFGTLVSTSNAFVENNDETVVVRVKTDAPVLWTVEVDLL